MDTILFSPLKIGQLELKNRIDVPPMCMWKAKDGFAQDFHLHHYAELAASGVGCITIEATGVTPNGRISPWCLGIWDEAHMEGIAKIVRAIKQTSPEVKVILQIAHAGRKGSMDPATDHSVPVSEGGWETVAPSAISAKNDLVEPRALAKDEIAEYAEAFGEAASRAVRAGVDAVEIHAAHGYLIHEFLSPLSNKREDEYGGSLENRMRFAKEVMAAVKRAVPEDFPVGIRISATDWAEGGWNLDESVALAQEAQYHGLFFIDVSTGGLVPCPIPVAPGYQLPYAEAVKRATNLKVFGVGLITNGFQAETILQLGICDVVDIGRAILADPNWGWRAARELHVRDLKVPMSKTFVFS